MSGPPLLYLSFVNLADRWALSSGDEVVTIHKMFDGDGNVTDDPSVAVTFTAGNDAAIYAFAVSEIVERRLN